mgnify:CR=1 FL=1
MCVFFSTQLRLDDTFWQLNARLHHELVNPCNLYVVIGFRVRVKDDNDDDE